MKNKLLLTTVFKPFGCKNKRHDIINGRHSITELYRGQVMIAQDIFPLVAEAFNYGSELIALNLKTPTTVLHFPSLKEFEEELRKGYTHVGIQLMAATFEKAKIMSKLVREKFPDTKICFGGYGATIPEAKKYCDHLCTGEGIDFFRKLFNEPGKEYEVPIIKTRYKFLHFNLEPGCIIPLSVGCPNGCDFCSTSYHFDRKVHRFVKDGHHLLARIREAHELLGIDKVAIIAEDFLLERDIIDVLIKEVPKLDFQLKLSCFASLKAISHYMPEELLKAGISSVWIGIESKNTNFEKAVNYDAEHIIRKLHDAGINVLCSYIVGFDYHSEQIIKDELKWFFSLQPDASQFLIHSPALKTPFRERLEKEGRLLRMPEYLPYTHGDGFSLIFKHKNFSKKQLEDLQYYCFRKDYEILGPSALRNMGTFFRGYKNLKKSKDRYLQSRAEHYKKDLKGMMPLLLSIQVFAPSERVKMKVKKFREELKEEFGDFDIKTKIFSNIVLASAIIKKLSPKKWKYAPKLVRSEYNN
ncbi:radical SAM protein [Candidatus Woesearchaeota archaeon]|nr:radical SAM protein [Candidatus Woesearchaeota archaeon]